MNGLDGAGCSESAGRRASTTLKQAQPYKCQKHWQGFCVRHPGHFDGHGRLTKSQDTDLPRKVTAHFDGATKSECQLTSIGVLRQQMLVLLSKTSQLARFQTPPYGVERVKL